MHLKFECLEIVNYYLSIILGKVFQSEIYVCVNYKDALWLRRSSSEYALDRIWFNPAERFLSLLFRTFSISKKIEKKVTAVWRDAGVSQQLR